MRPIARFLLFAAVVAAPAALILEHRVDVTHDIASRPPMEDGPQGFAPPGNLCYGQHVPQGEASAIVPADPRPLEQAGIVGTFGPAELAASVEVAPVESIPVYIVGARGARVVFDDLRTTPTSTTIKAPPMRHARRARARILRC